MFNKVIHIVTTEFQNSVSHTVDRCLYSHSIHELLQVTVASVYRLLNNGNSSCLH